ncbi:uncharacterized protein LOC117610666 [Osmia lignaria lignaria]|uniref:uncharacterized protein LOC117610666 n=1 Tax=Osmia lignaria lignaria TaxID=1437193 RepID=UPI00402B44BC
MYGTNNYPEEWKKSYIHFINKPDGKSVRPISLTSCLCKLFESLVKNKLDWWIEHNNFLPRAQSGFRKGHSTADNLINLTISIEEASSNKKDLLAVFLDINSAFDNVNIDILLSQLAKVGCPASLVKFIQHLTFERLIFTEATGINPRKVYKGVPQGGVLSPILFNIYVSTIAENIPKGVTISKFADDIAVYSKNKKLLEKTISRIYDKLLNLGLELLTHKTTFVHFNKHNIKPGQTEITIKDTVIKSNYYPIHRTDYYALIKNININTEFGKTLVRTGNPNTLIDQLTTEENSHAIYTDGSKSKESPSVGSACMCKDLNILTTRSIHKDSSIFTAECVAISDAMDIALKHPNRKFLIFTDSLSVLLALTHPTASIKTNPYILEIKRKISELCVKAQNSNPIKLYWIPGHKGIRGNEEADQLAKAAANLAPTDRTKIPFTDLSKQAKTIATNTTRDIITQLGLTKGKNYFTHFHNNHAKPWFTGRNLKRETITVVNRCRAGHYNLAHFLTRINIVNDPKCQCGYERQDIGHVFWQCSLLDDQRKDLICKLQKLSYHLPLSCNILLQNPTTAICNIIQSFLKSCNLSI